MLSGLKYGGKEVISSPSKIIFPESGFSSAMEQARLPYANEKDEEVPF